MTVSHIYPARNKEETMELKPIDTEYKGYRFRSRLEARWAVFFDTLQVQFDYEPEGFQVNGSDAYLPDFYLPDLRTYVEIKPTNAFEFSVDDEKHEFSMSGDDIEKYANACNSFAEAGYMFMILCGDPIDVICKNHGGNGAGWIFERMQCLVHASKDVDAEVPWDRIECKPDECETCDHYAVMASLPFAGFGSNSEFLAVLDNDGLFPTHWQQFRIAEPDPNLQDFVRKNIQAAKKARQARFEYGEKG